MHRNQIRIGNSIRSQIPAAANVNNFMSSVQSLKLFHSLNELPGVSAIALHIFSYQFNKKLRPVKMLNITKSIMTIVM